MPLGNRTLNELKEAIKAHEEMVYLKNGYIKNFATTGH